MNAVCVFCGSRPGDSGSFAALAAATGRAIAQSGRTLIYGGGRVGLMGALADGALSAGGTVIGVIPKDLLNTEIAHQGLQDLRVVTSMHERKALMASLAEGFIALPGGLGTLEEFFEIWTWAQLGIHDKPLGLLDADDFFAPLLAFLNGLVTRGFLGKEHRDRLLVQTEPGVLLEAMNAKSPGPNPGPPAPGRTPIQP